MKNLILLGFLLFGFSFFNTINAEENPRKMPRKEAKGKKTKPQLVAITVTGKISKAEIEGNKDQIGYILTSPAGNIVSLPDPQKLLNPKKNEEGDTPEPINLDDFLDVKVTIFGKGYTRQVKDGNKVSLKEIISIRKVIDGTDF